jgi:antitoxin (DNA-binding transcriptional repressor) of toxin-antitoxin stability system
MMHEVDIRTLQERFADYMQKVQEGDTIRVRLESGAFVWIEPVSESPVPADRAPVSF